MCGGDDRIGALNKKVEHRDQMKVLLITARNLKVLSETIKLECVNGVIGLQSCSCNGFSLPWGNNIRKQLSSPEGLLIRHKLEFCLRLETLMCSVFLHLVTLVVISAMWSQVSQVQYSLVRDCVCS